MLIYLSAFLLTVSQFTEPVSLASVTDQVSMGLEWIEANVEIAESKANPAATAQAKSETTQTKSEVDGITQHVAAQSDETTVTTTVPETTVIEEPVEVVEADQPAQKSPTSVREVAKVWPKLSEEARESIMLLIEIDLKVE